MGSKWFTATLPAEIVLPATKEKRDDIKKSLSGQLTEALQEVNEAKDAGEVDVAVNKAQGAADTALDLAAEAFKKARAPGHTPKDEDVEGELDDFARKAQIAAEQVRTAGDRKKASPWP